MNGQGKGGYRHLLKILTAERRKMVVSKRQCGVGQSSEFLFENGKGFSILRC